MDGIPPTSGDSLLSAEANRRMFDGIAARYDLLNRVLSLGLDRGWRRRAAVALGPRGGGLYLDVGCGTGDVLLEVLRRAPGSRVVGVDAAEAMMAVAASKAERAGVADSATFVAGDGLRLPFADRSFDGVVGAFCLRNFTDRGLALREMRRVLVPGGRAVLLETGSPAHRLLRLGHRCYVRVLVPVLGCLLARSRAAYQYLAESVEQFPQPPAIVRAMIAAGFVASESRTLWGGIVTLYVGQAP